MESSNENRAVVDTALSSFRCETNSEIESFLYHKAVEFEKLSKSRTYLVFNDEQMTSEYTTIHSLEIYGYISLAVKTLSVDRSTSNRKRRELDGYSSKIHGKPIEHFPCYLIGQLARNSRVDRKSISGKELIQIACDIIDNAEKAVGGRYIMVECDNEDGLIHFYEQNEFIKFADVYEDGQHVVQMLRKIQ